MLLLPPAVLLATFLVSLLAARRARGPLGKAALAAGVVAVYSTLPATSLALVASTTELAAHESAGGLLLVLFCYVMLFRHLKRPFEHALPIDDEQLNSSAARVAARAGLATTPRLFRLRTFGAMPIYGWVAVLQKPEIILADGLVHRLEPAEHEAVLAHELAHLATGSIWWLILPLPLAASLSLAMLPWLGIAGSFAACWALASFLQRVITRPTELLCDRRAAGLSSAEILARALEKMHRVHPVRDPGWRWVLAWALASHPPVQLRLHALGRDQGPLAGQLRFVSVLGFTLWLLAFAATLAVALALPGLHRLVPAIAWGLLALALVLSLRLGARDALRRQRRLVPPRLPGRRVEISGAALLLLSLALIFAEFFACWLPMLVLGGVLLLLVGGQRSRGANRLRRELREALQHHDFERVHRTAHAQPRRLARDPALRHDVALASIRAGYEQDGLDALEALVTQAPALGVAPLSLGKVLLESDPQRAQELAALTERRLPREPGGPLLAVQAARRLGRADEARLAWKRAQALAADEPMLLVLGMELALDEDDTDGAKRWSEEAESRSPGELMLLLARTRLALIQDEISVARGILDRTHAILNDHPFAFVDQRVAVLERELARREAEPPPPGGP